MGEYCNCSECKHCHWKQNQAHEGCWDQFTVTDWIGDIAEFEELSSFCLMRIGALGGVKSELEDCRNGFYNVAENFS